MRPEDTFIGSVRSSFSLDQDRDFPNPTGVVLNTVFDKKLSDARIQSGRIFCSDLTERPNVKRALKHFDRVHQLDLSREARALADPAGTLIGDSALPASVMRNVIREALSDLKALDVVQVIADPAMGSTVQIPFEVRLPGALVNNGIVYEGQGIPRAAVQQGMALAYVNAMKLSFLVSNEVDFFSRTSSIDWSALDRLVALNADIIRQRVHMRICNELQRAADSFNAVAVTGEDISGQLNGSNSLIKTAQWPVVRPMQVRDLQGTAVGPAENPLILTVNDAPIPAFDGSGKQPVGTYWLLENPNLGFVRLVTQAGVAVRPVASGVCTLSYSKATNISTFDLKLPASVTLENHLNGVLRAIAAQKSILFNQRFVQPNFAMGSAVLLDLLTNASSFSVNDARNGTNLDVAGDLGVIKAMPAYSTNAPGVDFGDERILIGERGTATYAIARPWSTGQPFEAVDATGKPTGQRQAYGEEYNAIFVPSPIRYKLTSVIVYDSDARAAAS